MIIPTKRMVDWELIRPKIRRKLIRTTPAKINTELTMTIKSEMKLC